MEMNISQLFANGNLDDYRHVYPEGTEDSPTPYTDLTTTGLEPAPLWSRKGT